MNFLPSDIDDFLTALFRTQTDADIVRNLFDSLREILIILRENSTFLREISIFLREILRILREISIFLREIPENLREISTFLREILRILREISIFLREILRILREISSSVVGISENVVGFFGSVVRIQNSPRVARALHPIDHAAPRQRCRPFEDLWHKRDSKCPQCSGQRPGSHT
ncbi:MAG: hypothetical protein K9J06_10265 [Flavobacteriales bacterium]|nr:hypothetical protein [Flavobacteriales bacterium]